MDDIAKVTFFFSLALNFIFVFALLVSKPPVYNQYLDCLKYTDQQTCFEKVLKK